MPAGLARPTPGEPSSGISVNRHQEASHERPCNAGHHRAAPEIDITNASDVAELITAACAPGVPAVIADLTATSFCDSAGLSHLIQASHKAAANGTELRLAISPDGAVSRIIELTGISQHIPVYPSAQLAAESGGQAPG
jgi:anti-sigma B factor antagonist